MNYQIFNSKQLNPNQLNSYYNLPINTQNQNIAFPNQTIYTQNLSIQNHIYNYQGQIIGNLPNFQYGNNFHAKPIYINNNYLGNNQGIIGNNFKSKTNVVPIFVQENEKQKQVIPFKNKPDSENKIKIIFKSCYEDKEMEFEKNAKFGEIAPSSYHKYIFNGKIIDKNKTLAELGIYNNSKILEIDEDVQDLLDHSPLSNGNNSENEKQIIYFYFILELENSTRYKMLIQSKNVRNLWEVFLYFNKKIRAKVFDIISFISIGMFISPTILNPVISLNELGIKNFENIFISIKQNIWIIDENPLITQED